MFAMVAIFMRIFMRITILKPLDIIGGVADKIGAGDLSVNANVKSKFDGVVEFENIKTIKTKDLDKNKINIVMTRTGEIRIVDSKKNILMSNNVPYGSHLVVNDDQKIKKGDVLCKWDPYNALIISEFDGKIEFESIEEGVTFKEEFDDQTGHKEKIIIECNDKTKNPTVKPNTVPITPQLVCFRINLSIPRF